MPNKPQEQFCIREFQRYLQGQFPSAAVRWRTVKHDPPDFWLWCDGDKYAVEVTRILHEEDRTVAATQWALVRQAEAAARESGTLAGKYVVAFHARLANGRQKSDLKRRILDFVELNTSRSTASRHDIVVGGRLICDIHKFDEQGAAIYPFGGGSETGGFEGDIREEVGELLRRSIAVKAKKLAIIQAPAALVFYDLYRMAGRAVLRERVRAVPEARRFAYIYVVQDKGLGFAPVAPGGVRGECHGA